MNPGAGSFWQTAASVAFLLAAIVGLMAAVGILARRQRFGVATIAVAGALLLTAMWTAVAAAFGGASMIASIGESVQKLGWLAVLYRLFATDGRHASVTPIRPVIFALIFVEACNIGLELMGWHLRSAVAGHDILFKTGLILRLLGAVGGLVLVHNLYLGASAQSRLVLRWPVLALAQFWAFDLNFYTIAYLMGSWPGELAAIRGFSVVVLATLLSIGAMRGRETVRLRPSRTVAFQTVSLILIGTYLLAMFGIAQWLAFAGGDFARLIEFSFLIVAVAAVLIVLPSRRLRGWMRVTIAKHFFQHRYDYRGEWLRFTRTIGNAGDPSHPLQERVVQAVADIADCPAGLLLEPDENGELVLAARWQWNSADVPAVAMTLEAVRFFEQQGFIVDLDDLRAGLDQRGETAVVPEWLLEETRAWVLVPLIHYERLTGVVVLARPPFVRKLDWEDYDLLRVVGRQLASYLAEHAG
ncbi:MAG: GAF domain-containing protein, partial [Novosphingobium sp.]